MTVTLFDRIQRGDVEGLRRMLAADPAAARAVEEGSGNGALIVALYSRQFPAAELLRAALTPLDWREAAAVGDCARLELLLEREPGILTARAPDGFTALHLACFFGRAAAAALLLARGADKDALASGPSLLRPVHSAAAGRDLATVRTLLAARPDVNARQARGFVALHAAAQNGDLELLDALLAAGADPALATDDGRTALAFAESAGHVDSVRRLKPR